MTGTAVSLGGFAVLLGLALAMDRCGRRSGGATAATAVTAVMRTPLGRVAVFATWLWLGVHFLAR